MPDGRAKAIRADCEASLEALDGLPIDLYLLHAPDPRTPLRTSVRALARLVDDGLVAPRRRVQRQPCPAGRGARAARRSPRSRSRSARSTTERCAAACVERCAELGIAVIAHSPLGGPKRAPRAGASRGARRDRRQPRSDARRRSRSPGSSASGRRSSPSPERAGRRRRGRQHAPLPSPRRRRTRPARPGSTDSPRGATRARRRRVVVMGVPGAGKSRVAADYAERGYVRLNRDERGGSLADLADALDEVLASGSREVVLDNTYLKRAARNHVVEAAARHGIPARCIWVDTLARAGAGQRRRAAARPVRRAAGARGAGAGRPLRGRSPLADAADARVPRARATCRRRGLRGRRARAVRASVADRRGGSLRRSRRRADPSRPGRGSAAPHLVFDWRPGADVAELEAARAAVAAAVSGPVEAAVVPCIREARRPAGAARRSRASSLAFARRHGVDPANSLVVGASAAHRTLANALAARYVQA